MERKKHSLFDNIRYVLRNVSIWNKSLFLDWFMRIFINGVSVFMLPFLVKLIISQIERTVNYSEFIIIIIGYSIFAIVAYVVGALSLNNSNWKNEVIRVNFVKKLLHKSLIMEYEKLENPNVLDQQQRALNAVNDKTKGIGGMLNSIITIGTLVIQIIAAGTILLRLKVWIVIVLLGLLLAQFIPTNITKERDKREVYDTLAASWRKLFYLNRLSRHSEFTKEVRLFRVRDWVVKKQLGVNRDVQQKIDKSCSMWVKCHTIVRVLGFLQEGFLYIYLVYCILYKGMLISDFTFYLASVANFSKAVSDFLWEYAGMRNLSNEIDDFRCYVESEDEKEGTRSINTISTDPAKLHSYEFVFENVSFKYAGQDEFALKNLNLTIERGKKLAIVGLNGAGKTTIIKLLCRLYEPTEGRILINGVDIREINKHEYFSLFSPVFQNVEAYAFSIAENISMKSMDQTNVKLVNESIDRASFRNKIQKLPDTIYTQMTKILFNDGVELSGGEKQRLALARALYKNGDVVVLDEPTAAMDAISEYEFYSSLYKLSEEKTTIFISHRLSSTRFCDEIILLEHGEIVERGTHDELMGKADSKYAELYRVQAQYYCDKGDGQE